MLAVTNINVIETSVKIYINEGKIPELPQMSHRHEHKVLPANTPVVVSFLASHWTWDLY
jgi:hypothetical protein